MNIKPDIPERFVRVTYDAAPEYEIYLSRVGVSDTIFVDEFGQLVLKNTIPNEKEIVAHDADGNWFNFMVSQNIGEDLVNRRVKELGDWLRSNGLSQDEDSCEVVYHYREVENRK